MSENEDFEAERQMWLDHQKQFEKKMAEMRAELERLRQTKGEGSSTSHEENDNDNNGQPNSNDNRIAVVSSYFKLMPFWKTKPETWFGQVESIMRRRRLTTDVGKYDAVIEALDEEALDEISDILADCPDTNKYEYLRRNLIKRFTESTDRQLHKFLSEVQLGDKKPSQLLRQMRELVKDRAGEELVRTKWISLLPLNIRNIIKAVPKGELKDLAEIADAIIESQSSSYQVMAVEDKTNKRLTKVEKDVEEVLNLVKQIQNKMSVNQQNNHRSRSHSRNGIHQTHDQKGICHYHIRYGDRARKCIQPCAYVAAVKPNQENSLSCQ